MSQEKTSLTAALRHLAEQERRTPSEHATPGELTAYHEGTLPPPIEARVREHLAHCKLCSDLLLDLAGFADLAPPPGVPELTDAEVEEDWQALRARMGEGEIEKPRDLKPPGEVVPIRPILPMEPKSPRQPPPWFAIAASLLAVLGLSFGLYERREVAKIQEPQWMEGITLSADQSRSSEREETKRISSQAGGLLFLQPDLDEIPSAYAAQIVRAGKVIFELPTESSKSATVIIPRGALNPGEYQIRLFGIVDGSRVAAGEFPLRVDDP